MASLGHNEVTHSERHFINTWLWLTPITFILAIRFNESVTGWWSVDQKAFTHDDVIKWKHFPRNWPFAWGIHRAPVNSSHKRQWRGALMFSLTCAWTNDWANNLDASDLRRHPPLLRHRNVYHLIYHLIPVYYELAVDVVTRLWVLRSGFLA